MVQSGSWLASESTVTVDTKWGGAKTFFSGEGLFMLRCSGSGDMLVASYGAIFEMDLPAGESYKVDTGHIVAFEEGIGYQVNKVGGLEVDDPVRRRSGRHVHRTRQAVAAEPQPRGPGRLAHREAAVHAQLTQPVQLV